ncbi:Hypothetical predicted protein [Marmota monax]|uniref:Uncharacterized protein n=1 Tax=Marmota monax TaxID=9995 RepID=A0A5E4BGK8_MARMO|nr:Hypothetical predicted protein [Marmota monax]
MAQRPGSEDDGKGVHGRRNRTCWGRDGAISGAADVLSGRGAEGKRARPWMQDHWFPGSWSFGGLQGDLQSPGPRKAEGARGCLSSQSPLLLRELGHQSQPRQIRWLKGRAVQGRFAVPFHPWVGRRSLGGPALPHVSPAPASPRRPAARRLSPARAAGLCDVAPAPDCVWAWLSQCPPPCPGNTSTGSWWGEFGEGSFGNILRALDH